MANPETGSKRKSRGKRGTNSEPAHAKRTQPMSTGNEPSRAQIDGDEGQNDGGIEREAPIGDIRDDRDVERERP
jgi:hypothetical protein